MDKIRVWRSPESEAVVRALQNLQELSTRMKDDTEAQEYESIEPIQAIIEKGGPRNG